MLLVETLCKLVQIFPPKVLVYTRKIFLITFLTNVIKENLRQNTLFDSLLNIAKQ